MSEGKIKTIYSTQRPQEIAELLCELLNGLNPAYKAHVGQTINPVIRHINIYTFPGDESTPGELEYFCMGAVALYERNTEKRLAAAKAAAEFEKNCRPDPTSPRTNIFREARPQG